MLHTPLCDLLRITHPICQAGMATYTSPELVAAVSGAGGLGVHGALGRSPDEMRSLVRATRALLRGEPFGVNHVIGRIDERAFAACLEEGVPIIALSWGDPRHWAHRAQDAGAKVLHQVTTVDEVSLALDAGVDAIIAQGTEGGGHSGFVPLDTLLPAVVAAAGAVPVIAAGGIADGRALAAALALGAAGAWIGTRFLATPEAPISPAWKRALVLAGEGETVHTEVFDTLWGQAWPGGRVRAIRNRLTAEWAVSQVPIEQHLQSLQEASWKAEREDNPDFIALMAGTGVGAILDCRPAAALVLEMAQEASAARRTLARTSPE